MKIITTNTQITNHFHAAEFACKGSCNCGKINIDELFVNRMELLYNILNRTPAGCSFIYINSGYRCAKACNLIKGAFIGDMHNIGAAADFHAVDNNGQHIDSITLCEAAQAAGFGGIAVIDAYNVHADDRQRGDITYQNKKWYGNESTGENYMTFKGKSKYSNYIWTEAKKQIKVTIEIDDHKYSGLLDGE